METTVPNRSHTLPLGWTETTLGAIGRYLNGRAFKTSEWSKTGRPIIRIQDLTGSNRNPNYFEGEVEERYVIRTGDLLISWSATLGAYIWNGPEAVLNQHIFKVESKINARFHYHLVRERIAELERNTHGSGMVHVTKGTFENTPVTIPTCEYTQQYIANLIDSVDSKKGSASQHLCTARQAIERFRQAILAAACSGRLTTEWRKANPHTQTVEQALAAVPQGKRRTSLTNAPTDLILPDLPDNYVVTTIRHASTKLEYGTSKRADALGNTGIPILRMGNIQDGQLKLDDLKYVKSTRETQRLILENGDLLFNRTNSPELVGKSAVFHERTDVTFASYLIRVRFAGDIAEPDFVNFWINSAWGKAWARHVKTDGVSQSNINGTKLGAMPLPLPPIEEQREIVRRASGMLQIADDLLARCHSIERCLDRSSQAVLVKAFRGEMTFPDNDNCSRPQAS
jgi:type I restriction enzyme S subunit